MFLKNEPKIGRRPIKEILILKGFLSLLFDFVEKLAEKIAKFLGY
jgi:hypothetical protein